MIDASDHLIVKGSPVYLEKARIEAGRRLNARNA